MNIKRVLTVSFLFISILTMGQKPRWKILTDVGFIELLQAGSSYRNSPKFKVEINLKSLKVLMCGISTNAIMGIIKMARNPIELNKN